MPPALLSGRHTCLWWCFWRRAPRGRSRAGCPVVGPSVGERHCDEPEPGCAGVPRAHLFLGTVAQDGGARGGDEQRALVRDVEHALVSTPARGTGPVEEEEDARHRVA